jgi:hypothetical protein
MPRCWYWLVAALIAIVATACTPSPPTAVKPSPTVSTSPAVPLSAPTPSPAEPSPTPFPTPTVYPRLPIPAGTARCHTSQLEVAFITGDAAAGSVEDTFEMRNTSPTGCWVYGYVGFQTLDRNGRPLPQSTSWSTKSYFGDSEPPSRILLPPGMTPLGVEPRTGHAFFNVFTSDVLCDVYKDPVASIKIWPPDEYQPLTIPGQRPGGGLQFGFCFGFGLNPLQIQPLPRLG